MTRRVEGPKDERPMHLEKSQNTCTDVERTECWKRIQQRRRTLRVGQVWRSVPVKNKWTGQNQIVLKESVGQGHYVGETET